MDLVVVDLGHEVLEVLQIKALKPMKLRITVMLVVMILRKDVVLAAVALVVLQVAQEIVLVVREY